LFMLNFITIKMEPPENTSIILGQAHFIKTVEDLHEALTNAVPDIKFGIAFCEASGPCLVRHEGNDPDLRQLASEKALQIACGHTFLIIIKNAYPINVLDKIKAVPEVCNIFAATSNPLEVIIAQTEQGRGIIGIIDGNKTKAIENPTDITERRTLLRNLGYKL
jgi:adenosine/AMP kinase